MAKFCKFDETPSWPCRWKGEPTAEDGINCQLFTIKNSQYRLLKSFEEVKVSRLEIAVIEAVKKLDSRIFDKAVKEAVEEVVKKAKEAMKKTGRK